MESTRWEPYDGLNKLQARIHDLFDESVNRARSYPNAAAGTWLPPVDILESKEAYLIRAELPGMKKENFNLEFNDGTLTLNGERKFDEPANGVEYHRVERVSGKFSRSFHLPQTVKAEAINANYRDGILEIQVPKADEAKPRQIAINVS